MKRNNNKGIIAFEKTRNIVSALYLITDFIPERDPIRNKIRETAVEAVTVSLPQKGIVRSEFRMVSHTLNARLVGIGSLLDIAHISGFVSDMNHKLISNELNKLIDYISSSHKSWEVFEILGADRTDGGTSKEFPSRRTQGPFSETKSIDRTTYKGHSIGQSRTENMESKGQDSNLSSAKIGRKELILSELRRNNFMSVRDLVSVIKGVSEKTIQRDLVALTKDKSIKKTGEKRWSRYSLVERPLSLPE